MKYSGGFINQTKNLGTTLDYAISVTADVLGLYPSIAYEAGLRALSET